MRDFQGNENMSQSSQPIIGQVTATENRPTTYNSFRFWLSKDYEIRIFDVVRVGHLNGSFTYAIVKDLQYITDSAGHLANYVSSDFGDVNVTPENPRLGTTIAEADVLYNTKDIEMPVRNGAQVQTADAEGVRKALGLDGLKKRIPAGYISMSYGLEVPIEFDASYLLGPEGAHLNVAGISGLATKTSYVMFLLRSIQQVMGNELSMILFNVKGDDLLAIDRPQAAGLTPAQVEEWKKCNLAASPFENVTYLYPFADRRRNTCYSNTQAPIEFLQEQHAGDKAFNFYYDVAGLRDKLYLLLSDVDDPNSTFESIFDEVRGWDLSSWDSFRARIGELGQKGGSKQISVMSWRKFGRFIKTRTDPGHGIFVEPSVAAAKEKRQQSLSAKVRELRRGQVLVIDIEPLPDYLQCLVVGDVISTLRNIMLGEDDDVGREDIGKVLIFADELNKYAPKSDVSGRSLTLALREITERGRSLGTILFGAEQFRSGVDDRVLGNCSTNVFGRTSPVEIGKCQDYRYFPDSHKASVTRLEKGCLLLQHAVFKTYLIKVRFPFPCYHKKDVAE
jgi:DNA helicase HerA-like ATPase